MEINSQPANCSDNDLAGFLQRALAMQIYPVANSSTVMTDTGLVSLNASFCFMCMGHVHVSECSF